MTNWINRNKTSIIRNSFLVPILLVVIMSISHVVSWYELGNPMSWAIYLSVAIEIFALASVSASTLKVSKGAIWFLFSLVTLIQIIGNIFFEYKFIEVEGDNFKSWLELISPIVDDWGVLEHKRLLAIIQGGTLPIMSLTALHFFIQFNEERNEVKEDDSETEDFIELDIDSDLEIEEETADDETAEEEKIDKEETEEPKTSNEILEDVIEELKDTPAEEVQKVSEEKGIVIPDEPTELQLAKNYWGKTKGSFGGVSEEDIINHYNSEVNTLMNPKLARRKNNQNG